MLPLTRALVLEIQYEMLCARTARRQRAAKAAMVRRGVLPRVCIGKYWVPPSVARAFTHMNVGDAR
jgi:predicted DNA-binding transcriptional regulator